jgi:hypothetical protein
MSLALTSPLYQGTVLTDLIDLVEGIVPVSLDAVSGSAHPPSPEHWAACRNPWCRDLNRQWMLHAPQPGGTCPKGHPLVDGLYCFTCAMKRDDYLETRCMECEREVPKVEGTDWCSECLAKIQREEL